MFGKTGVEVSEIGLGTWQLGGVWGDEFQKEKAQSILSIAYENGINFIDTADVYNEGNSELAIGEFGKGKDDLYVVTKSGRQLNPHIASMYTIDKIERYIDDSLERLDCEQLDMVLLHCPPSDVYDNVELFQGLDRLVEQGKLAHYGVSVEKVSEAIQAVKQYNVSAVEIIFNMFRLKPMEEFFALAKEKNIGVIVRVPLASGLLTGKFTQDTHFGEQDHRSFNREGAAFDKGETFSGISYEKGLEAVKELQELFGTKEIAPYALKWILMFDAVSTVIPGASSPEQVLDNLKAADLPDLTSEQMERVQEIYKKYFKEDVHGNW